MTEPRLRVISLGAGVQSTTLALMAAHGELSPMPDCAIFADTGWEPAAVYDHLRWISSPNVLPFPVHTVSAGNIREHMITGATGALLGRKARFASAPWFIRNPDGSEGMGRRQCTSEFKVEPLIKKQRELLGFAPRKRIPKGSAEVWIGISLDEAIRMKPARAAWQTNRWPLIERRMHRSDCLRWLERQGYPTPPKSACIGCPFTDNSRWRDLRNNSPTEWQDAVEVDRAIRHGFKNEGRAIHAPRHGAARSSRPLDGRGSRPAQSFPQRMRRPLRRVAPSLRTSN